MSFCTAKIGAKIIDFFNSWYLILEKMHLKSSSLEQNFFAFLDGKCL